MTDAVKRAQGSVLVSIKTCVSSWQRYPRWILQAEGGKAARSSVMPWSHYMTLKVVRSLYCSHYTTFCLVIGESWSGCGLHATWLIGIRGSHITRSFTRMNPWRVCLVSKLRFVTKTHTRSDTRNVSPHPVSCALIGCSLSLPSLPVTTLFTLQDLDSPTGPDI